MTQPLEPKVPWKNGKLIEADHFQKLERWVESLVGWGHGVRGDFGLVRAPHQKDVNAAGAVLVPSGGARWSERGDGRVLLVTVIVEKLQAITPSGRPINVAGTLTPEPLELSAEQARRSFLDLALRPGAGANPELKVAQPEDGDAVRVARLLLGDKPKIDTDTYIPPCVILGGCEASQAALHALGDQLAEVASTAGQRFCDLVRRHGPEAELARSIGWAVRAIRALAADAGWPPGRFFHLVGGWLRSCLDDLQLFAPGSVVPFEDALRQLLRADPRKDLRGCLDRADVCLKLLLDVVTGLSRPPHPPEPVPEPEPMDRTLRVARAVANLPSDQEDVFCQFVVTLRQPLGRELDRAGNKKGFEVHLAPGNRDGEEGAAGKSRRGAYVLVDPTVKEATAIPNVPERKRPLKKPRGGQPGYCFDYVPPRSERELDRIVFYLSKELAENQGWVGDVTAAVTVVGSDT